MDRVDPVEAGTIAVRVAFSPRAGEVDEVELIVPAASTIADALAASGLQARHPDIDVATLPIGMWGKVRAPSDALRDGDRVELYRPLKVDPKEARRQRYKAHLAKYPAKEPGKAG